MSFVHKSIRSVLFSFVSQREIITLLHSLFSPESEVAHLILIGKLFSSTVTLKVISVVFINQIKYV